MGEPARTLLATDIAVSIARNFLLKMSQPFEEDLSCAGASLLTPETLKKLQMQGEAEREEKLRAADSPLLKPAPLEKFRAQEETVREEMSVAFPPPSEKR